MIFADITKSATVQFCFDGIQGPVIDIIQYHYAHLTQSVTEEGASTFILLLYLLLLYFF